MEGGIVVVMDGDGFRILSRFADSWHMVMRIKGTNDRFLWWEKLVYVLVQYFNSAINIRKFTKVESRVTYVINVYLGIVIVIVDYICAIAGLSRYLEYELVEGLIFWSPNPSSTRPLPYLTPPCSFLGAYRITSDIHNCWLGEHQTSQSKYPPSPHVTAVHLTTLNTCLRRTAGSSWMISMPTTLYGNQS